MTNLDRAEAILAARHYKDQMEGDGAVGCFDAAAAVAELAAAGLLAPDLPAPTLAEMTTAERAATVGMWATINPSDDLPAWRGIIARANRSVALVCNPDDMRMGLKPDPVTASIVTPDPSVPRAWNANGDPAHPEPAPDFTLTPGSMWRDGHNLENALDQSPYTSAVVMDRDDDIVVWADGYWEGAGFQPDASPDEGPWKIIWVGNEE